MIPDDMEVRYRFDVEPVAKPRMTRRDKWAKRPCVLRYWDFVDDLRVATDAVGLKLVDVQTLSLVFIMPMPSSWSAKKRARLNGQLHLQRPDLDNMVKAFKDAILKEDSSVHTYRFITKVWGDTGEILLLQGK